MKTGRRIKLDGTLENKAIKKGRWYLAHTDYGWQLGQFEREWFGWSLVAPASALCHHQLDDIDDLYEVTLPKLRKQPTQSSIFHARRKKAGVCLHCNHKGTPQDSHSRGCPDNPNIEEAEY